MTDKQALREAATEATQGGWYADCDFDVCHESGAFLAETHGDNLVQNAKFIAAANPATVLALLDALDQANSETDKANALIDEIREERNLLQNLAGKRQIALEATEKRIAELEARQVDLRKYDVAEVMLISGFSRDYAEGWCSGNDNAIHEIRAAGIGVKGE